MRQPSTVLSMPHFPIICNPVQDGFKANHFLSKWVQERRQSIQKIKVVLKVLFKQIKINYFGQNIFPDRTKAYFKSWLASIKPFRIIFTYNRFFSGLVSCYLNLWALLSINRPGHPSRESIANALALLAYKLPITSKRQSAAIAPQCYYFRYNFELRAAVHECFHFHASSK